jgi:hypothetical protein
MFSALFRKQKKIPGLSYAVTEEGVELPVLDITHPLFAASTDENTFAALSAKAAHKADEMRGWPAWLKRFLARISNTEHTYLSGMRTLVLKLGPKLIAGRKVEFWYRLGSKQFNAIAIRIRLRNICRCQANLLIPQLRESPDKNLCFINIAGGTASDSINTLVLIQQAEPALLLNRKIEINVLDLDHFGPWFAQKSIEALTAPAGRFHDLDITFRHIAYNWTSPERLKDLLWERKTWIQACASEGGLFEYGSDADIIRNLNTLCVAAPKTLKIAGTLLLDKDRVNPAVVAGAEITGVTMRFIGLEGLKNILGKTEWMLESAIDDGSIYAVFILKRVA